MKLNLRREPLQDSTEGGTGGGAGDAAAVAAAAAAATAAAAAAGGGTGDGKKDGDGAGGKKDGGKAEGDGGAGTGTKDGDGTKPASKAPEKYALTLPEGGRLDKGDLSYVETLAREAGMSNEDAQAWVNEQHNAIEAQSARFLAETKADKELGGAKLPETQQLAKAAIDRIFPEGDPHRDGFLNFLRRGGGDNNINAVRALVRIGKLMAEDSVVGGTGGGGKKDDTPLADRMYPSTIAK